jgi:hypothetical protein
MGQKQLMVNKIIENKGLSAVNQLLTQAKGTQRLKALIQKALNGPISSKRPVCYAACRGFRWISFNF